MNDKKVKGSMFLDFVRLIRANKDRNWDQYLKPGDWGTINSNILPSAWYPFEMYQRFGMATFNVLAKGNLDMARLNGKISGKMMFENVYKLIVAGKDTLKSIQQFVKIYGSLFNFSMLKFEKVEAKHARVYHIYDPNDPADMPFCHQLMGILDILVEMTGGTNARIEMNSKQWEGAPATTFDITWE
jgi:hypothetical protein